MASEPSLRQPAERQTEGSQGYASPRDEPKGQSPRQSCPGWHRGPVHVRRCSCQLRLTVEVNVSRSLQSWARREQPWGFVVVVAVSESRILLQTNFTHNYFKKPLSQVCKKKAKCLSFRSLYSKEPPHTHRKIHAQ